MSTFYTTFKNIGSVADDSALVKHANSWSNNLADNAVSEENSMCDLLIDIPVSNFNNAMREYTMIRPDSQKHDFVANDFWNRFKALISSHPDGIAYTLRVKQGLEMGTLNWNSDVKVSSDYNPLALLIEHISAPALGFPTDDEAANVDYSAIATDIALGNDSQTVGSFVSSCESSILGVEDPIHALDGSNYLVASLLAFCDAISDSPNGLDDRLYLKGADLGKDVQANPQDNLGQEFVFHASVKDSFVMNFVIGQTRAGAAKDGCGRLIINVVDDPVV